MKNYLFSNYTHIEYNALKYIPAVVQKKGKLPPTRFPQVRQLVREAPETIELLDSSAEPAAKADLQRVGSGMFDVCVAGFVGVVRGRERGGEGCVCGRVTCKWFRTKVNWGEG